MSKRSSSIQVVPQLPETERQSKQSIKKFIYDSFNNLDRMNRKLVHDTRDPFSNYIYSQMPMGSNSGPSQTPPPGTNEVNVKHCKMGNLDCEQHFYPGMASDILNNVAVMYMQQKLCDVELIVPGSEPVKAHRLILAAASPYFRAMFTNGHRETHEPRVIIQDISYLTLMHIIRFVYTGCIKLIQTNVCELLVAAQMIQMPKVTQACCEFLERQLDPENCIGIMNFAHQNSLHPLYIKANQYIDQHFQEVSRCEEFLELPFSKLITIIRKDELYVRSEMQVFEAVIRWIQHDGKKRTCHLKPILQVVRCHFLSPTFLEDQLANCELVKSRPECYAFLRKVIEDLNAPQKRYYSCCNERSPKGLNNIYVIGGYGIERSLNRSEFFSPATEQWEGLAELPMARSGVAAVYIMNHIYALGGRIFHNNQDNVCEDTAEVHGLDMSNGHWKRMSPMRSRRHRHTAAAFEGQIFVIGGSNMTTVLSSVERYNPEYDAWCTAEAMPKPRFGHGSASVCRNLYVIGGSDGNVKFADCIQFNAISMSWNDQVAPMSTARSGLGVAAHNQYIYAVGGHDGQRPLNLVERFDFKDAIILVSSFGSATYGAYKSCGGATDGATEREKYDTQANSWSIMPALNTPRSALGLAVVENKIYAVGGFDGSRYLETIEIFDLEKPDQGWVFGPSLPSPRSGHGVCISRAPFVQLCDQSNSQETQRNEMDSTRRNFNTEIFDINFFDSQFNAYEML